MMIEKNHRLPNGNKQAYSNQPNNKYKYNKMMN